MAGTVETLHHKFISKLNTLEDLGLYVHEAVISYEQSEYFADEKVIMKEKLDALVINIARLKKKYHHLKIL